MIAHVRALSFIAVCVGFIVLGNYSPTIALGAFATVILAIFYGLLVEIFRD